MHKTSIPFSLKAKQWKKKFVNFLFFFFFFFFLLISSKQTLKWANSINIYLTNVLVVQRLSLGRHTREVRVRVSSEAFGVQVYGQLLNPMWTNLLTPRQPFLLILADIYNIGQKKKKSLEPGSGPAQDGKGIRLNRIDAFHYIHVFFLLHRHILRLLSETKF